MRRHAHADLRGDVASGSAALPQRRARCSAQSDADAPLITRYITRSRDARDFAAAAHPRRRQSAISERAGVYPEEFVAHRYAIARQTSYARRNRAISAIER